jgi:hypothetical protein
MSDYLSADGRVRILSIVRRADWHRLTNRRGGRYTTWSGFDMREGRWIAQEAATLGELRRRLIAAGYGESLRHLHREK